MKSPEIIEVTATPTVQPLTAGNKVVTSTATELAADKTPAAPASGESQSLKVSALSLASIRAKKELQQANQNLERKAEQLPTEPFTETAMLEQWNKYAQRLGDKGQKIMESLLLINDPILQGSTIVHELPNQGSKIDFESEKNELQGYLRGKLHNHDITIEVRVNESVENKFAFTAQDKYNRLNQINPTLEVLKKTFDLDF